MKTKEKAKLHAMSMSELMKFIDESQKKLAEFMLQRSTKQMKNVRESKMMRQQIAIAQTILRQKEITHDGNS